MKVCESVFYVLKGESVFYVMKVCESGFYVLKVESVFFVLKGESVFYVLKGESICSLFWKVKVCSMFWKVKVCSMFWKVKVCAKSVWKCAKVYESAAIIPSHLWIQFVGLVTYIFTYTDQQSTFVLTFYISSWTIFRQQALNKQRKRKINFTN